MRPPPSTSSTALLQACKAALKSFTSSGSTFRIVHTTPSSHTSAPFPTTLSPHTEPSSFPDTRTLYIFDSSFNPPTLAHLSLALPANTQRRKTGSERGTDEDAKSISDQLRHTGRRSQRLLLLFSTHNADKAGTAPAAFEHRLAMMVLFARDLAAWMIKDMRDEGSHTTARSMPPKSTENGGGVATESSQSSTTATETAGDAHTAPAQQEPEVSDMVDEDSMPIAIDVGLTNKPYYTDKTAAIVAARTYAPITPLSPGTEEQTPRHIHLTGYDTFTRIFEPKYYSSFDPPLSALAPYFDAGHGLKVMVREDEEAGSDERGAWGTAAQQRYAVERLARGELEDVGGKKEWGDKVDWVDDEGLGRGVSSTKVRKAVEEGNWEVVRKLCTSSVSAWVREWDLYT